MATECSLAIKRLIPRVTLKTVKSRSTPANSPKQPTWLARAGLVVNGETLVGIPGECGLGEKCDWKGGGGVEGLKSKGTVLLLTFWFHGKSCCFKKIKS
jgi:hypothetical protein